MTLSNEKKPVITLLVRLFAIALFLFLTFVFLPPLFFKMDTQSLKEAELLAVGSQIEGFLGLRVRSGKENSTSSASFMSAMVWQNANLTVPSLRIRSEFEAAAKNRSVDEYRNAIEKLRLDYTKSPRNILLALVAELESGVDLHTGFPFVVGYHGIAVPTTYRVFLLDILGDVDAVVASRVSRIVLDRSVSVDEWAVALRNIARESIAKEDPVLRPRLTELVRNREWSIGASRAFLESLDLVAATKQYELIPDLVNFVSSGDLPSVKNAAWLALERFSIIAGASFVNYILDSGLSSSLPPYVVANFVARLDPNKFHDRSTLTRYALAVDSQEGSWHEFEAIFPLHSMPIGPALVTNVHPRNLAQSAMQDLAALKLVEDWMGQPQFQQRYPDLSSMRNRILANVESAKRGGVIL